MKKKVLILTELTVPYTSGSGINAFNFAKALAGKSFQTKIISLNWGIKQKGKEIIHQVVIRRIPFSYNKHLNRGITLFLLLPFCMCQFAFFDTILIYGRYPGLKLLIQAGWMLRKKIIFQSTALGHDDFDTLFKGNACTVKSIRKKMHGYYSLSPAFSRIFLQNVNAGKPILFESPQGVDTCIFFPVTGGDKSRLKRELGLPGNKKIIITVANLIRRKGFEDIFKILQEIRDDFVYIVIGNSRYDKKHYFWQNREEMDFLARLGKDMLGEKILFAGRVDHVDEYLKVADVFLLNSEKEGLPNAILEAMACGVVPVFREIDGLLGYVAFHGENALVFKTRLEMKTFLLEALHNGSLRKRIGENAIALVKEKCSMKVVSGAFIKKFFGTEQRKA